MSKTDPVSVMAALAGAGLDLQFNSSYPDTHVQVFSLIN
jgi:hypothetical protein